MAGSLTLRANVIARSPATQLPVFAKELADKLLVGELKNHTELVRVCREVPTDKLVGLWFYINLVEEGNFARFVKEYNRLHPEARISCETLENGEGRLVLAYKLREDSAISAVHPEAEEKLFWIRGLLVNGAKIRSTLKEEILARPEAKQDKPEGGGLQLPEHGAILHDINNVVATLMLLFFKANRESGKSKATSSQP